MHALYVVTHYHLRILNYWKALGTATAMSLDLKRQLIAQLVESSRLLRNYIDQRAKGRGTTRAQWIVLFRLRQQEGLSQVDLAEVLELQPISLCACSIDWSSTAFSSAGTTPRIGAPTGCFLTARGRQLVDDLDSLRDTIAIDVLQDIPSASLQTSLATLKDIKERIKASLSPAISPQMIVGPSGTPRRLKTRPLRKGRVGSQSQVVRRLPGRAVVGRRPPPAALLQFRLPQKIWRGNNSDSENPAPMWIQLIQAATFPIQDNKVRTRSRSAPR